jgi:hypothetical protein
MKKQGDTASVFRNHTTKKQKFISSSLSPDVAQRRHLKNKRKRG